MRHLPLFACHRPRRVPLLSATLLALGLAASTTGCVDKKKEISEQTIALQQVAGGGVVSNLTEGDPMPRSNEAKALWVARRGLGDLKHLADSVSAKYGIDVDTPPAAVNTQEYFATAGQHPEVRRYFAQYQLYAADMRDHAFEWVRARMKKDLEEAGLTGRMQDEMFTGFDAKMPPFKHAMDTAGGGAGEMVALHDFLVSVGSRVQYADGMVRFERQADLDRAQEMQQHARAQFQEAAQYAARSQQEGREQLQSLSRELAN